MTNTHWGYAVEPIDHVYTAHAFSRRSAARRSEPPSPAGCMTRVLEDMDLSTEAVSEALAAASRPSEGEPCAACIHAAKALLELDEPNRFYAVQSYHYPNSTMSYGDWLAITERAD